MSFHRRHRHHRRWGPLGPHHAHGDACRHGLHAHDRHPRRLFWRVYLHGIFLLIATFTSVALLGWLLGRGNNVLEHALRFKHTVESGGPALLADRPALEAVVEHASDVANVDVTIYDVRGGLLATNVTPPLPQLPPDLVSQMGNDPSWSGRPRQLVIPLRMEGETTAYALADWRGPGIRQISRGVSYLLGVLLVLALASLPLVRGITSPIERLTNAVRALGGGDLTVRSGIRRTDEVGELASAFDEMAGRLERLVRNERELLANVSHELRTPLSRIRVALELAAEGDAKLAQRYLKEIGSDLAELEQLVEDVLTTARLDAASRPGEVGFSLHLSSVPPSELLEAAARRFRDAWPGWPLLVEVPSELPELEVDPVLVRRVLDNLLDNARKYSDEGRNVTLHAAVEDGLLHIEVRDQGIGMTEDDLRQLFTPFFRTDRSRQRGTGGVGLGLALAKRIIEAHQGSLTATSAPGRGSTFTVHLPLARS